MNSRGPGLNHHWRKYFVADLFLFSHCCSKAPDANIANLVYFVQTQRFCTLKQLTYFKTCFGAIRTHFRLF